MIVFEELFLQIRLKAEPVWANWAAMAFNILHVGRARVKSFHSCPFFCSIQTQNRMKLMADNYEDEHLKTGSDQTNHKPSPDQVTAGDRTLTLMCC